MSQFLTACRTAKSKGKHFLNVAGASAQNAGLFATVIATGHVLAKDPGWNLKRITGQDDVRGHTRVAPLAAAHRRHEERGLLPAGAEANDNIPAPGLRLRPGRGLDAAVVDRRRC